ncbi:MAG: 2-C-methyl-D-erythritol 2,4-cyclodiphosphate synthase [Blastocatellia bacterium]
MRIGFGSDIHRLAPGRRLVIGGVEISADFGSEGHSDGDTLSHAITDAILGALALGDIGQHFPDNDPKWKGADSREFLRRAADLVRQHSYSIVNVDSTVHLEGPKLRPYIEQIRTALAAELGIELASISVKAKSGEGMDSVGEKRAIRAEAVVLLALSDRRQFG